jgi:hypothetical protein
MIPIPGIFSVEIEPRAPLIGRKHGDEFNGRPVTPWTMAELAERYRQLERTDLAHGGKSQEREVAKGALRGVALQMILLCLPRVDGSAP